MPSTVSDSPVPVSRLPSDDELYVMNSFALHAKGCRQCAHPLDTYLDSGTLCEEGIIKAEDVVQYVYNCNGMAYSLVNAEGYQQVYIEIPHECEAVRELLQAVERGMQFRYRQAKQSPIISQDRNYFVPARPVREITPAQYVYEATSRRRHGSRVYRR